MKYRADIDGLRAFAIIPVVLYHAGITMFSGGFVGVDVFFVISGYLITTIILNDIEKGKFSIASFYFRRIKRIFPALYFFFIVTSIACWFLYMPADLKAYGKSLFGSVFFISNIVFWRESGYFDTASELKPLLHTWSLSVEEQFYIFFPVLMIILAKYFRKKYVPAVLTIFILSFLISIYATPRMPSASFFLLPTRAWELMIGCLLALGVFPKTNNIRLLNLASFIGLFMLLLSIFVYEHGTPFPGYQALLPCVGTALIIYTGGFSNNLSEKPLINRFIAWKPFVLIGLVSYSWYLWHWPVFAFRHYYDAVTVDMVIKSNWVLIPFTLLMAIISYFLVEKPFRDVKWENRNKLFAYSTVTMVVFSAIGLGLFYKQGIHSRFSQEVLSVLESKSDINRYRKGTFINIGDDSVENSFLLWGDSHTMSITPGIEELIKEGTQSGLMIYEGGCPPLKGVTRVDKAQECLNHNEKVLKDINTLNVKRVILVGNWTTYIYKDLLKAADGESRTKITFEERVALVKNGLAGIIESLQAQGKEVVLFSNVPTYAYNVPDILGKYEYISEKLPESYKSLYLANSSDDFKAKQEKILSAFHSLEESYGISVIDLSNALCSSLSCLIMGDDGKLYYADEAHLTMTGAKFVTEELREQILPFLESN